MEDASFATPSARGNSSGFPDVSGLNLKHENDDREIGQPEIRRSGKKRKIRHCRGVWPGPGTGANNGTAAPGYTRGLAEMTRPWPWRLGGASDKPSAGPVWE